MLLIRQPAFAQESSAGTGLQSAALNPEYVDWLCQKAAKDTATDEDPGFVGGHVPAPFDLFHPRQASTKSSSVRAPASYDLRDYGRVTSVKNQGNCGSCWSFATYGSLESTLLGETAAAYDFSENHLKNTHGYDLGPCSGGNTFFSCAYLTRWSGPVAEADDPYHAWDDRPSPGGPRQKFVRSVVWYTNEADIKDAVRNYGGLYVSFYYNSAYYNATSHTYYYDGPNSGNHAVLLIGWDDDLVVPGAPGVGAWLVKNSWGSGWGEDGYFWISYYDSRAVSYGAVFKDAVPAGTYRHNYQYDPLGMTNSLGYNDSVAWGANWFVPVADEFLEAVAFYAVSEPTYYEIYIYDQFDGGVFSGLLASTTGSVPCMGFYTVSLPEPVALNAGDGFAVVMRFVTPGYNYPLPAEINDGDDYSSQASALPGQSYVSHTGGFFSDITDQSGYENTNICIKALTVADPSSLPLPGDFEPDGDVDAADLAFLCRHWLEGPCTASEDPASAWCEGADLNRDGSVNIADWGILARHWLQDIN